MVWFSASTAIVRVFDAALNCELPACVAVKIQFPASRNLTLLGCAASNSQIVPRPPVIDIETGRPLDETAAGSYSEPGVGNAGRADVKLTTCWAFENVKVTCGEIAIR